MDNDDQVKKWKFPKIRPEEEEMEQEPLDLENNPLIKSAIHEGFQRGLQKGVKEGEKKADQQYSEVWKSKIEILNQMIDHMADPISVIDKEVEQVILSLVTALTKRVILRELKTDPSLLLDMVHEAKHLIPISSEKVTIQLSQEDYNVIGKEISKAFSDCTCVASAALTQGEFKIKTPHSQVIADLDERVDNLVNQVFKHA